jgi:hypothetical protein
MENPNGKYGERKNFEKGNFERIKKLVHTAITVIQHLFKEIKENLQKQALEAVKKTIEKKSIEIGFPGYYSEEGKKTTQANLKIENTGVLWQLMQRLKHKKRTHLNINALNRLELSADLDCTLNYTQVIQNLFHLLCIGKLVLKIEPHEKAYRAYLECNTDNIATFSLTNVKYANSGNFLIKIICESALIDISQGKIYLKLGNSSIELASIPEHVLNQKNSWKVSISNNNDKTVILQITSDQKNSTAMPAYLQDNYVPYLLQNPLSLIFAKKQ